MLDHGAHLRQRPLDRLRQLPQGFRQCLDDAALDRDVPRHLAVGEFGPLVRSGIAGIAEDTGDGAYDRDDVYAKVAARHPAAALVVPPRANAVPSETAGTAPTQRDRHLRCIAECGSIGWRRAFGYNWVALVHAEI